MKSTVREHRRKVLRDIVNGVPRADRDMAWLLAAYLDQNKIQVNQDGTYQPSSQTVCDNGKPPPTYSIKKLFEFTLRMAPVFVKMVRNSRRLDLLSRQSPPGWNAWMRQFPDCLEDLMRSQGAIAPWDQFEVQYCEDVSCLCDDVGINPPLLSEILVPAFMRKMPPFSPLPPFLQRRSSEPTPSLDPDSSEEPASPSLLPNQPKRNLRPRRTMGEAPPRL